MNDRESNLSCSTTQSIQQADIFVESGYVASDFIDVCHLAQKSVSLFFIFISYEYELTVILVNSYFCI